MLFFSFPTAMNLNIWFVFSIALPIVAIFAQDHELESLLNIKSSFHESNPLLFDSWAGSKCNFTGITCDSNGFVSEIDLSRQNLKGRLMADQICRLEWLEKLSLGSNGLYGTISQGLNNCSKLVYLDLGSNLFSGTFPGIPGLSRLKYMYLNNTGVSGAFPWESLANITGLVALSLGDNLFDTTHFPKQILGLYDLNWIYMSNCSLQGTLPMGLGNISSLVNLELSYNNLQGPIPPDIGNLTNLWQLELYANNFSGQFPAGFGNLHNLVNFDASMNNLEGDLSELSTLSNLQSLQLFDNRLSGNIPHEFGNLRKLVNLSLYTNSLTGPLPSRLGSWANFHFIDVSENFLTGPIPPDMCKQGTMQKLLMLQNKLTGTIPPTYANCPTLVRFRVNNNLLTGDVPRGIWGLPNLNIIDIRDNQLQGTISTDIANAKSLGQLFVANNRLSGDLPPEICKASALSAVDLSCNRFFGPIPTTLGELKRLGSIRFENNSFSGPIPKSLGECNSLTEINMAHNLLSGEIPYSIGSLPALNSFNLSGNKFSGQIPASMSSARLSLLDLTNNKLSGPIPWTLTINAYNGSFAGNAALCSSSAIRSFRKCSSVSRMPQSYKLLITFFAAATIVLGLLLVLFTRSKRTRDNEDVFDQPSKGNMWDVKSFQVMSFTEDDIVDSIKDENLIGKGGSGLVYKVELDDGVVLAVKHVRNSSSGDRKISSPLLTKWAGRSREFEAEVIALSSLRHVNVVKLYCTFTSGDSNLLVYEYMPNGSLWDRLHGSEKMMLDWDERYEISMGAAKGLEYLHHGCERPIIHRDVKSSNILLDEYLKPRIADFGLARIVRAHSGKDSSYVIAGTIGYFPPEYGYSQKASEKSDVYSFGVVLMELVTGKKPIEPGYGEDSNIVKWVYTKLVSGDESILSMVDPSIVEESMKEYAIKVLRIAVVCTARLPEHRPTMRSVVKMLEEAQPCRMVGIVVGKDGAYKQNVASIWKPSPN